MQNKMLIDASHEEEVRVAIIRGNRVEDFDFETAAKRQIKSNIYLAKVTRVEPSLQACFVDYGGNRHGFLAFSEIHPDYYQIPLADREALLAEEQAQQNREEEAEDKAAAKYADKQPDDQENSSDDEPDDLDEDNGDAEEKIDSLGADDSDSLEDIQTKRKMATRKYKIQDVIKRRQILLVQVVKEERGNKGAALTTYISMAGRYCVLMPNTPRGGGISRKITNGADRKRLKEIVSDLDVPKGMGVILRTAGASRTKVEIKRDFTYLIRLWEKVRSLTLQSIAPTLVHEEGSLIKRSIRDLYNRDIEAVFVAGDEGYREAKDFMRMLMPSHAKNVQPYKDDQPVFIKYDVERQLDAMFSPVVTLKSGGYIVLNQTEALVSIDVNSGKATREHNIEDTATKTNLEAAEEIARQLRLRDLAGLVVIDFIDMDDKRNNRSVERKLKDCLKNDRARIQVGRISSFGLLEMSRQRIRASVLESTMDPCPHCAGSGYVRAPSSVALSILRQVEDSLVNHHNQDLTINARAEVALYILNDKRRHLMELEKRYDVTLFVKVDKTLEGDQFVLTETETGKAVNAPRFVPSSPSESSKQRSEDDDQRDQGRNKKRRRRKKSDRYQDRQDSQDAQGSKYDEPSDQSSSDDNDEDARDDKMESADEGKKRRRGRRGGRRRKNAEQNAEQDHETAGSPSDETARQDKPELDGEAAETEETVKASENNTEPQSANDDMPGQKKRRSRRRPASDKAEKARESDNKQEGESSKASDTPSPQKNVEDQPSAETDVLASPESPARKRRSAHKATASVSQSTEAASASDKSQDDDGPRKKGWWQRRSFF
jgi:ribonuclease E